MMINKLKIFTIALFLLIFGSDLAFARDLIYFQGTITEINSGIPIPFHPVTIFGSDSSFVTTNTNEFGEYFEMVEINIEQSNFVVSTYDCEYLPHSVYFDEVDSINIADFSICYELELCTADFFYEINPVNPLEVWFFDNSSGSINSWFWNFSDGSSSYEQNPVHEFAAPGLYLVGLLVADSAGFCFDTISKYVFLPEDSILCKAAFTYEMDTLNNTPFVYQFYDESEGSPDSYFWDFGDGNFSSEKNPSHAYLEGGNYSVCLTISNLNNPTGCTDEVCDSLSTLEYHDFGGQVFIGDFTINIEENDSSNIAVANLYRRIENKWEFMDQMSFWKYGYYWFLNKPTGDYLIRVDLQETSIDYNNYAPSYHNQSNNWEQAKTFVLSNDEQYAININLTELAEISNGIGYISGTLHSNGTCEASINFNNTLVQLYNTDMQLAEFTYSLENGFYEFNNLGIGNYFVKAEFTGKSSELYSVTLTENNNSIAGIELAIGCDAFIGINEKKYENVVDLVSVFPVPAAELLNISLNSARNIPISIELINLTGKTIFRESFQLLYENQQFTIPVNSFPAGLYILRITNYGNKISINKKIVIGR